MTREHDPVELSSGRLTVRFLWSGDRFSHELLCDGRPVAASVEGTSQDDWPPSPPLQSLSLEDLSLGDRGQQKAILGVGAAGRGHWSISVLVAGDDAIQFELACRASDKSQPVHLGSVYRISGVGGEIQFEPAANAKVEEDSGEWNLTPWDPMANPRVWSYTVRVPDESSVH